MRMETNTGKNCDDCVTDECVSTRFVLTRISNVNMAEVEFRSNPIYLSLVSLDYARIALPAVIEF